MGPANATRFRPARPGARGPGFPAARRCALASASAALALLVLALTLVSGTGAESPSGMAVSVARAKRECFSDVVRVTGTVVPKEELQVRPEIEGGRVAQMLVDTGDRVTAGQVLARLARPQGVNMPASSLAVQPASSAGS